MIPVSNDFKDALVVPKMQDGKITYDSTELDGDTINSMTRIFDAGLFKTCMKGLNIDTNDAIPKGTTINAQFGVYVNNAFEYADLGDYKTHEPKKSEDLLAYTTEAYDKIEESMIDYDLTVTYPITVRNMFVAIFERLNWSTSGIPATFVNYDEQIKTDVWSGIKYTFRDCLDELCTITCQWLLDKDGVPTLMQPTTTNQTIDENFLSDTNVEVGNLVFFNALIFSRVENADLIERKDDDSIAANGLHAFTVKDNQLLSTNDRSDYIDAMWNYIKTFQYYSFDANTIGIVFLEPIDLFTLSANGNTYSTLLLSDELEITSGTAEQIYSEPPNEEELDTKYARDTDKTLNQAYILVDKQNQTINSFVNNYGPKVNASIKDITPYFAVNTSKTTAPESGWSTTMPTRQVNEYMWRKDKITLQNDTSYYETPYVVTGDRGNDGASGSEIWTTSTAPTTPNYTFNISDLLGPPGDPVVGDIILYSYYRYTINTVSTTTVKAGNRQSLRGAKGDTGDTGPAGQDGAPGQDGADGSQWYQGTAITGTSGDLTGHKGVVDDQYLNSSTGNTYVCVTTGTSSTAIWHYSGNIKGADGQDATITSDTPPLNPTEDMLWLDTTTNQLKKYTLVADQGGTISGTWIVVNDYTEAIGNVQHNIDTATSNLQTAIGEVNDTLGGRVEVVENHYTTMEQTQSDFEIRIGTVETFKSSAETVINNVESSFTFGDSLLIGKSNSDYKFELTNTGANILYKNNVTSWWDPHNFNSDGVQTNQLGIGPFKFALRSNGSLSFRKEG